MSTPQSMDGEAANNGSDPPGASSAGDKAVESSDAATNGENPSATPAAPPARPSDPAQFVNDPNKISLKFIFANRDGVSAIVDCKPTDTIGEVKGALLSMWPEDLPACSGGDKIRLICMGKGMLSPDTKTLEGCDVPVFQTHPTPVNVAVKPEISDLGGGKKKGSPKKHSTTTTGGGGSNTDGASGVGGSEPGTSGCSCVIS